MQVPVDGQAHHFKVTPPEVATSHSLQTVKGKRMRPDSGIWTNEDVMHRKLSQILYQWLFVLYQSIISPAFLIQQKNKYKIQRVIIGLEKGWPWMKTPQKVIHSCTHQNTILPFCEVCGFFGWATNIT